MGCHQEFPVECLRGIVNLLYGSRWNCSETLHIGASGGRVFCNGKDYPRQYGRNDILVIRGESLVFLFMIAWKIAVSVYVCEASHVFFYSYKENRTLFDVLKVETLPSRHSAASWVMGTCSTLGRSGKVTTRCRTTVASFLQE